MEDMQSVRIYKDNVEVIAICRDGGDDQDHYYLVEAESAKEAIELVSEQGVNLDGHEIVSDYDCTGQWFASNVTESECEYIEILKMWCVPMRWRQDV